jgi:hypothetical protein
VRFFVYSVRAAFFSCVFPQAAPCITAMRAVSEGCRDSAPPTALPHKLARSSGKQVPPMAQPAVPPGDVADRPDKVVKRARLKVGQIRNMQSGFGQWFHPLCGGPTPDRPQDTRKCRGSLSIGTTASGKAIADNTHATRTGTVPSRDSRFEAAHGPFRLSPSCWFSHHASHYENSVCL